MLDLARAEVYYLVVSCFRFPKLMAQFVLKPGSCNQRAIQWYRDGSQRPSGTTHQNPCSRIRRAQGTCAIEIAKRTRYVDNRNSYRAAQPCRTAMLYSSVMVHSGIPAIRLASGGPPAYPQAPTCAGYLA